MVLTPKVLIGKNMNIKSYATENYDIHVENITLLRKKIRIFLSAIGDNRGLSIRRF